MALQRLAADGAEAGGAAPVEPLEGPRREGVVGGRGEVEAGAQIERAAPASFDDHFSQVTLFYNSLTDVEKAHTAEAYTFELGKCYEEAIKVR